MEAEKLKIWLEGALLAAGQPLSLAQLNSLFEEQEQPGHSAIREALALLDAELSGRAVALVEVAGGYRLQIRQSLMPVVSRLWTEKTPRYSRALLETLAIIAYRQPITRSEIEQIRGVSLSANILKTVQEREWVKVVGHRDIPGKPELLGTTRVFLDYFGLKGLDDLPTLAEIRDLDDVEPELELNDPEYAEAANHEHQEQAQHEEPNPERYDSRQSWRDRQEENRRQKGREDHRSEQQGPLRETGEQQTRRDGSEHRSEQQQASDSEAPTDTEE